MSDEKLTAEEEKELLKDLDFFMDFDVSENESDWESVEQMETTTGDEE